MTGAPAQRRTELALAATVATVALLLLVVALDAFRFHLPAVVRGERLALDAHSGVLLALMLVEAVVLVRAVRSAARQLTAQRRLRRLRVLGTYAVGPHGVAVVAGSRPAAFCAGLLRPRLYVTEPALARLAPDELRAVVEHEAAHARRRDPLRLAVVRVVADGLGFIPPLGRLGRSQAAVADLAADRAAVEAVGSPRPLAAAMLQLEEPVPERVDHLLGRPARTAPRPLFAAALAVLASLAGLAVTLAVVPSDPTLPLGLAPALVLPAVLAFRAARA